MKNVRKIGYVMVLFVLINMSFSIVTYANQVGFSVAPVLPSNQIDKESGYFHIQLKAGNKQQLSVELKNHTEKEMVLKTSVASATTNINGVIDYSPTKNKVDETLPINLSKQITVDKIITLSPKEEKIVSVKVSMPNKDIPGVIASGISFEEEGNVKSNQLSSQTTVNNKFSYVLALLMQQSASIETQPELKLGKVKAMELNTKTSVSAPIRNLSSAYLNQVTIKSTLTKKGSNEPYYEYKKEQMQIAPNSIFEFPTFLNGKKLEDGEYFYKAVVSGMTGELNKEDQERLEWVLTDTINIDQKQAKELNELDDLVTDKTVGLNKWLVLAVSLNVLLVLGIVSYFLFAKKRNK
ncbi:MULTISPECIES: DUF916 and DUF3324 domain-containing protein [unclassified Vagococcus]|uniref:DUF916 and DUF3324 domain-containing protein n=1 Tax=unclassified Vagococcus TaxID=2648499 RepID=UPI001F5119AA|nr:MULTISPECIES: DUF916 and DUF3324 domain-containing protein [unclassified Vagococcus]MCI0129920.1 DUF916 and DUF3324 domain-containing protein [Vagococcus sp. CY53-2]UNM88768.1 DUF916 and DUF3324 domain-containing protein [Vagococcus sp. CY52-2]